jgi:hypothetical protein
MSYGAATAITATINSLANNASVTSSSVTNAVNLYTDALVEVIIATGAGTASTGYVEVFAKGSIDNTDFSSDATDRKIGVVATPTASTTYKLVTGIASSFGGTMPQYWQIRVRNLSGAALAASGNSASYSGVLLTSS